MARALTWLALVVAPGCFHATPYSPATSAQTLRQMRDHGEGPAGKGEVAVPAAGTALDAEQAYALAVEHNPDVALAAAEAEVAAATVKASRQLDNPQLRITNFDVDDAMHHDPGATIALRVPIPRPGTRRAVTAGADHAARAGVAATEDAKRLLRAEIFKLYAQLAMLRADLEQTSGAIALRTARREQIGARADRAVSTQLDVAMSEVVLAEARRDEASVRDAIMLIEGELTRLVAVPTPVTFATEADELRPTELRLDRDALLDQALAARPELHAAQALVVEAQANAFVAKGDAYPWFSWAQVQYRVSRDAVPSAWGFGVSITLPILSWNRGKIRESKAILRQRTIAERAAIVTVANEVDVAVRRVERTAESVAEIERDLLPKVEAAQREAEAALAVGALDPIDANDVDTKLVAARRLHLAALLAHREAVIDLEAVVGGPLPRGVTDGGPR